MNELILERSNVENAILQVSNEIILTKNSTVNWEKISEENLWLELAGCILGSRVKDEVAKEHFKKLKSEGILDYKKIINDPNLAIVKISSKLNKPFTINHTSNIIYRYPFWRLRARHIVESCVSLYDNGSTGIKKILKSVDNSYEAREVLSSLCMGIGPKQASLFLRNISYCDDLAILDSRVTNYMNFIGLVKNKIKILTKKQYIEYEDIFRTYSTSLKRPIGVLDLAIWVVMKVIKEECEVYGYNRSYVWWH